MGLGEGAELWMGGEAYAGFTGAAVANADEFGDVIPGLGHFNRWWVGRVEGFRRRKVVRKRQVVEGGWDYYGE